MYQKTVPNERAEGSSVECRSAPPVQQRNDELPHSQMGADESPRTDDAELLSPADDIDEYVDKAIENTSSAEQVFVTPEPEPVQNVALLMLQRKLSAIQV